jgi:arsenate reductase
MNNKKNILILCTGNSCRSIMAEALLNARLGECLYAQSSGVEASGTVNPNAQALLETKGLWRDEYHSKVIETLIDLEFDLVVTVCEHANETCPTFANATKMIHMSFQDPSGKDEKEYTRTLNLIEEKLLPKIKKEIC